MTSKVLAARTDSVGDLDSTWLPALADARAGSRLATVLWFGDSISELDPSEVKATLTRYSPNIQQIQ